MQLSLKEREQRVLFDCAGTERLFDRSTSVINSLDVDSSQFQ